MTIEDFKYRAMMEERAEMERQERNEPMQGDKEMIGRYQGTLEEKVYKVVLEEKGKTLSWTGCTLLEVAKHDSYMTHLSGNEFYFIDNDSEEVLKTLRLLANGITREEREALTEIVQAARRAALSINPDIEALDGWALRENNAYGYYKTLSTMIKQALQEPIEDTSW